MLQSSCMSSPPRPQRQRGAGVQSFLRCMSVLSYVLIVSCRMYSFTHVEGRPHVKAMPPEEGSAVCVGVEVCYEQRGRK